MLAFKSMSNIDYWTNWRSSGYPRSCFESTREFLEMIQLCQIRPIQIRCSSTETSSIPLLDSKLIESCVNGFRYLLPKWAIWSQCFQCARFILTAIGCNIALQSKSKSNKSKLLGMCLLWAFPNDIDGLLFNYDWDSWCFPHFAIHLPASFIARPDLRAQHATDGKLISWEIIMLSNIE